MSTWPPPVAANCDRATAGEETSFSTVLNPDCQNVAIHRDCTSPGAQEDFTPISNFDRQNVAVRSERSSSREEIVGTQVQKAKSNREAALLHAMSEQHSRHEKRIEEILTRHEDRIAKMLSRPPPKSEPCSEQTQESKPEADRRMSANGEERRRFEADLLVPLPGPRGDRASSHLPVLPASSGASLPVLPASSGPGLKSDAEVSGDQAARASGVMQEQPSSISKRWAESSMNPGELLPTGHTLSRLPGHDEPTEEDDDDDEVQSMDNFRALITQPKKLVNSRVFDSITGFVIIFNAGVVGVQAEWEVQNGSSSTLVHFEVLSVVFTVVFTLELLIRLVAEKTKFFACSNANFKWNLFDSTCVLSGLSEEVFKATSDSSPNVSAIRLLRMLRLVRVIRIVRVLRFFSDLRIMVMSIMGSMKALFWCIILLVFIMYIVSVTMMQLLTTAFEENNEEDFDREVLMTLFGSIIRALFTLYLSISNGVSWGDVAWPLTLVEPFLGILYSLYIAFAVFCVLNVVTGIFVENAIKISKTDEDHMILEEVNARDRWFTEVRHLFNRGDRDQSGDLNWSEFQRYVKDERIQAYFRSIGLDVTSSSIKGLFQLLDFDGDGSVNMDEFIYGCQKFHGTARALDVARLKHEIKSLDRKMGRIDKRMFELLGIVKDSIGTQMANGKRSVPLPVSKKPSQLGAASSLKTRTVPAGGAQKTEIALPSLVVRSTTTERTER